MNIVKLFKILEKGVQHILNPLGESGLLHCSIRNFKKVLKVLDVSWNSWCAVL